MSIKFSDRYEALGISPPDEATVCLGSCEGTGAIPIKSDERREPFRSLWLTAEAKSPSKDGWHFVICPSCAGTGKRPT